MIGVGQVSRVVSIWIVGLALCSGCGSSSRCVGQIPRASSPRVEVNDSSPVTLRTSGTFPGELDFAHMILSTSDTVPTALSDQTIAGTATLTNVSETGASAQAKVVLADGSVLMFTGPVGSDCVVK